MIRIRIGQVRKSADTLLLNQPDIIPTTTKKSTRNQPNEEACLQVASDARGRGVLRLILLHQWVNLACVPVLCTDLVMLAAPSAEIPAPVCVLFEYGVDFVFTNRLVGGLSIALGR